VGGSGPPLQVLQPFEGLAAALAVVTSFTFFATAQAGLFGNATAEETYNRLKDESTAVAQLILGARVSEHREAEAQTVKKFLQAVRDGVCGPVDAGATVDPQVCRAVHAGGIVDPQVARGLPDWVYAGGIVDPQVARGVPDWTSQQEQLRRTQPAYSWGHDARDGPAGQRTQPDYSQ
jgi:hypothetical protein